MNPSESGEISGVNNYCFREIPPGGDQITLSRLYRQGIGWFPVDFVHYSSAELLEAITFQQMCVKDRFPFNPHSYPRYSCDRFVEDTLGNRYSYHHIKWGEDEAEGDPTPIQRKLLESGFYSVFPKKLEIKVCESGYMGDYLFADLTNDFRILVQPSLLSSFLNQFMVSYQSENSYSPNGKKQYQRLFSPELSSIVIEAGGGRWCLGSRLNSSIHEYPWFSLKPDRPKQSEEYSDY